MIPEHRFGVAALGNVSDSNPGALAHATTDIVLEDVLEDALEPEPAKPSPEPEKAATATETLSPDCCGIYESPELSTRYEIVAEGDRVIARHARHPDIALRCTGQDELTGDAGYFQTLRFRRNEMRVVTGFDLTSGRVRNLRFISVNC